jgi:hypothetical protein
MAMLKSTTKTFLSTIRSAQGLNASTLQKSWKVIVTIGVFAAVAVLALCYAHRLDEQAKKKKAAEHNIYDMSVWLQLNRTIQSYLRISGDKEKSTSAKKYKSIKVQPISGEGDNQDVEQDGKANLSLSTISKMSQLQNKRKQKAAAEKKRQEEEEEQMKDPVTTAVEASLPAVHHSTSIFTKIRTELKTHHKWFSIFYFYSEAFPRALRVLAIISNITTMLFLQSITYDLANPDDGSCETYRTDTACTAPVSPFATGESKCAWSPPSATTTTGDHCMFIEPNNSVKIVLFVAVFSALISTPIAVMTSSLIKTYLAAPETEKDEHHDISSQKVELRKTEKPAPMDKQLSALESAGSFHSFKITKGFYYLLLPQDWPSPSSTSSTVW